MFEELLEQWANEQDFQTWSKDHAAVLRNLTKWLNIHAAKQSVQADLLPCGHSVDSLGGFGGCNPNGSCMECAATSR